MAFKITYARLFQCQIWQGYHLHLGTEKNFYELDLNNPDDAEDQENILNRYDIRSNLEVEPIAGTTDRLRGHRMKLAKDNSGFFVGISVTPAPAGGWLPFIVPDEGTSWHFGLRTKSKLDWENGNNLPFRPNFPAIYYFDNTRPDLPGNIGSLSAEVGQQTARRYEAGEMVLDPGGPQVYQAIQTESNRLPFNDTAAWVPINDHQEVNIADRVLLPSKFPYQFTPLAGEEPSTATIELFDLTGTLLQSNNFSVTSSSEVVLNYQELAPQGWHDLVVSTDTPYAMTHRIYINDELYQPSFWGVVSLRIGGPHPDLRLLEADNRLRQNAGITETPIFEIRVPNRYSFWRYVPHPQQSLVPAAGSDVELFPPDNTRLVTLVPQPLTRFGSTVDFIQVPAGPPIKLPSPPARSLLPDADGRVYSDVHLGLLNL
ncbi:MAG: hypothetical protein AAFQ37_02115 [Bacteroidota bacterium]